MTITIVRRLYFYAAAFIGLQMLAAGARDLLGALLDRLLAPQALGPADQMVLRLSAGAALLLIGLPLWAFHWWVVQRGAARTEERRSSLRRLYAYLVLVVAVFVVLFGVRDLLDALLSGEQLSLVGSRLAAAIATLVVYVPIGVYHWRVVGGDRQEVEQTGGPATLRRWYMVIVQAVSLAIAAFAAVDMLDQLLRLALTTAVGDTPGTGTAAATLIAGLAVWLPHHLWARGLLHETTSIQIDEARSILRQVYSAMVVAAAAVAAIGGLATILYAVLLAALGGASWSAVLSEHTQALALVVIAAPLWAYHRRQMAEEARADRSPERGETAQRVFGYLMAAVGLGALFFGLGGLLSTLVRLLLAPDVLGAGWREPLSVYLALSLAALPVYAVMAQAIERRAHRAPAEERALARRIYLYAALLFGIVAAVIATVALVRLVLGALLGAAEPDVLAEAGRWAGYALVGSAIAVAHVLLLRRASAAQPDLSAGMIIAVVADEPVRQALLDALARELPAATVRPAGVGDPGLETTLAGAEVLIVQLAALLNGPLAGSVHAFGGRRVVLAGPVPGYDIVGLRRGADALGRETAQLLRSALGSPTPQTPAPSPRTS